MKTFLSEKCFSSSKSTHFVNKYTSTMDFSGNGNDNGLDAAIRASLEQYQMDETNRSKRSISLQKEDEDLAMALKLSQQIWESQTDIHHHPQSDTHDSKDKDNQIIDIPDEEDDDDSNDTNDQDMDHDYQFEEEEEDNEFEDDDDWGDDDELIYDEQQRIEHKEYDEEDGQELMRRLKEKRRREQAKIENFWCCGKCQFLNHPSRPICMMCNMPELDVVHHILQCPKNQLKVCVKCKAYVVPHMYDNHVLDCNPLGAIDNAQNNQAWYVKLTPCEQNAINHVNSVSIKKSTDDQVITQLLKKIGEIDDGLYEPQASDVLKHLYEFMEWTVPIIIRIKAATLIPVLMKDTHYRSLFEINPGYKNGAMYNQNDSRVVAEQKMFGPVYNKATVFERPKYGCLNVGLQPEGCLRAIGYGDAYFLMNDATVRWRTTLTIQDSFAVNGNCGTVKHCNHLLIQLQTNELKELIEAALFAKEGGKQQTSYREIQIHGPVQLNRDIISLHVPNSVQHRKNEKMYLDFCHKNMCKLVWFDIKGNAQFGQQAY
eukprot:759841_1